MITAKFNYTDTSYLFEISGHANYAEHGSDIVCASVSVLSNAVANEILNRIGNATYHIEDNGFLVCSVDLMRMNYVQKYHISYLYEMLWASLKQIEQQYPDNIKVVVECENGELDT